jgi:hypothetical protein
MSVPEFVVFTPVPLRARCDGWSPALQLRFIRQLAGGMKPGTAARALGKNRQNAYALRKRPGAESFAAAWDAATAFAERARLERPEERQQRHFGPPESSTIGNPNFMKLPARTVAFRGRPLERRPC